MDEIPIETEVKVEAVIEEPAEVIEEEHKKAGRGRPKGVVNKPKKVEPKVKKTKPKPKPKKVQEEYSESEEEYEEHRQQQQQPVYNTRDIASEVISMLSNRHLDRSTAKRENIDHGFRLHSINLLPKRNGKNCDKKTSRRQTVVN